MPRAPRRSSSAVTMEAVARYAGVSAMSVSKVLNGRSVRPETRELVLRAIRELDYTPNAAARQLASASAISIGLLHHNLESSFFSTLLVSALNTAAQQDVRLLLQAADFNDLASIWRAIAALRSRGAKALILPALFTEAIAQDPRLGELDMPLLGLGAGKDLATLSSVRIDDFAAARDMTSLLLAKGHRRIAFLRPYGTLSAFDARRNGFLAAMQAQGVAADPHLIVTCGPTFERGTEAVTAVLDIARPPTAILVASDDLAAVVLLAAHMRGVRVPADLAVAGFDDSPIARQVWPPLTTVRQPIGAMVGLAIEMLVRQVRDGVDNRTSPKTTIHVDYTIVRRASTGD